MKILLVIMLICNATAVLSALLKARSGFAKFFFFVVALGTVINLIFVIIAYFDPSVMVKLMNFHQTHHNVYY